MTETSSIANVGFYDGARSMGLLILHQKPKWLYLSGKIEQTVATCGKWKTKPKQFDEIVYSSGTFIKVGEIEILRHSCAGSKTIE